MANTFDFTNPSIPPVEQQRHSYDYLKEKGKYYPVVRISDQILPPETIKTFELDNTQFLPHLMLELQQTSNNIFKRDVIKEGDKISFAIVSGNDLIRSMRCDFIVNTVMSDAQYQMETGNFKNLIITSELYIPEMYNDASNNIAVNGSSRDALIHMVTKNLKLSFFFNDPENTKDDQVWYCVNAEKNNFNNVSSIALNFLKNVTNHAYKDFNSFYSSWIDPRYGFTFLNVAKQLGQDGLDEEIDLTPLTTSIANHVSADSKLTPSSKEAAANPKPQLKLMSNIVEDQDSLSNFFILEYRMVNNAGAVTTTYGVSSSGQYSLQNNSLNAASNPATTDTSINGTNTETSGSESVQANDFNFKYSIPYNKTKIDSKQFFLMVGPGKNKTYASADNGSFVSQQCNNVTSENIIDVQSDGDTSNSSNGNSSWSGNLNKLYLIGEQHNKINNQLLEKMYLEVVLQGANLQIMRGEKVPVIIADVEGSRKFLSQHPASGWTLNNFIYELYSGWYVIGGIKWTWSYTPRSINSKETNWTTTVKLQRREWPIPNSYGNDTSTGVKNDATYSVTLTENSYQTTGAKEPVEQSTNNDTYLQNVGTDARSIYSTMYDQLKAINIEDSLTLSCGKLYRIDTNKKVVASSTYQWKDKTDYVFKNDKDVIYKSNIDCDYSDGNAYDFTITKLSLQDALVFCAINEAVAYDLSRYKFGIGILSTSYTLHCGTDEDIVTKWKTNSAKIVASLNSQKIKTWNEYLQNKPKTLNL